MPGIDSDLIRGHIDTIILNILAEGDRYGYEICKEVEIKSNGTYELKQPTLYSCLKRLEDKGLISSYWEDSDIGGKRHYYKLTDEGIQIFKQNQEDWKRSREIIDSLISAENNDKTAKINDKIDDDTASDALENEQKEDGEPLIFDEIDKEVEQQDNGFVDTTPTYLSQQTEESEAEKQGFNEVEEDKSLPFDDNDYSEYCAHLVKNSAEEDNKNKESSSNNETEDSDDILALLGHYSENENANETTSQNEEEISADNQESNYDIHEELSKEENDEEESISQEDAFLAKFITGKYSEYNPDREEFLSEADAEKTHEEEIPTPITTDIANINESENHIEEMKQTNNEDDFIKSDEEEFGFSNANLVSSTSFFDDNKQGEEKELEPTISYDNKVDSNLSLFSEEETNANNSNEQTEEDEYSSDTSPITYFNIDTPRYEDLSEAEDENTLASFKEKYDASLEEDDDNVVLDFSNNNKDAEGEDYSPSFTVFDGTTDEEENSEEDNEEAEPYAEDEQDDYNKSNSFIEDLEDKGEDLSDVKPFENSLDTTSVYDKANSVDHVNYTGVSAKEKLNGLTTISINPNIFSTELSENNNENEKENIVNNNQDKQNNTYDLSSLKATLSNEGITIRPYQKQIKEPESTKTFIETNKIKMVRNWITFFIEALLLGITLIVVSRFNFSENTFAGRYIYFLCGLLFFLVIAVYSTIKYFINPYKKITAKYAPRLSHLFAIIFTIQFFVIIYCINLQFGFFSFTQTDYNHLNWIVPCIVCLAPIISSIVYEILYKSKNFHV